MKVLVVNGGSSSFKCWFHELGGEPLPVEGPRPLWEGHVEWSGGQAAVRIRSEAAREYTVPAKSLVEPLTGVLEALNQTVPAIDVVGHRIVHGGKAYRESTWLTPEVRAAIRKQAEFAPAH